MPANAYLAIDLGAESGRVIAGELEGGRLRLFDLHRFPNVPCRLPTGLHWDLTGIWREVLEGIGKGVVWAADRGARLLSLGVDTWGVDYALLGRSGEVLGLPHCYRDERNGPAFEWTLALVGRERIYDATGIQFMALNTLYQLVAAHHAEPEMVEEAVSLLFMPDLLHYFFTGERKVEATIASTSQMVDPRTGDWAFGLLEALGLPARMLGPIVPAGATLGALLPEVAAATGAPPGLRVIAPGAHDTASAVAAVPADESRSWCFLSSGTWSLLGAVLDEPCLTSEAREVPFTNEGGIGGTIRFLKNITGLWLVQECRRALEKEGEPALDYATLTELAGEAEPFRTVIDPGHEPFLVPGGMPEKIAEFARTTGQPEPTTPGALVRCCLEGLALAYRHTLEQMERVLGRSFSVIHVVGGGGRNRLLARMTADATARPVVIGPFEATATGNVLTQAMGAGEIGSPADIRRVVAASFETERIEPRNPGAWDGPYARYREILER